MGCGALLKPGARFCGACGAQVVAAPRPGPPRTAPTPSRRRRPSLPPAAALGGGAVLVVALVLGGWFLFLRGDGSGDTSGNGATEPQESTVTVVSPVSPDAVDPSTGLPLRPGVRLQHPDGATAEIPGGPNLYGEAMDLRRVELADDPWWDHGGTGWEFVSFVGVPISGATVEIPAPANARLIAQSAAGLWVELPSEPVTLAAGGPGVRVRVDGVPAPWTFALASAKADGPEVTPEMQRVLDRELLYWTDRAVWERDVTTELQGGLGNTPIDRRSLVSLQPSSDPNVEYERIRVAVLDAYQLFAAARMGVSPDVTVAGGLSPIPGVELSAVGIWAEAVNRLVAVRDDWLTFRATLGDVTKLPPGQAVAVGFMDQWIETAMHLYTPWGLDFVAILLEQGSLTGFDLRVLKPYGELKWADVILKEGDLPGIDFAVQQVLAEQGEARIAGVPGVQRILRLYSVRALERLALIDWLKENIDWIVRWLPVALAGVGLIPGAIGLSLLFATIDQVINWAQDWYTADSANPYAFMAFEGTSAGAVGGVSFVMDMYDEAALMAKEGRPMLPAHGLTIAQFAYSVGMFAAVRGTDWYFFKTVRAINGDTRGYCHVGRCSSLSGAIPPVMIHANVSGLLEQPADAYPAAVGRMMAFKLEYGSADLHLDWLNGRKGPNAPLADLPFSDYAPREWPVVVTRTEPDYQLIRVSVPRSAIAPEIWGDRPKDTPIGEFGPVLFLEGPDGETATIEITEESTHRDNESADNFYFTVALRRADGENPVLPAAMGFGFAYEMGRGQEVQFPGGELKTKLTGKLQFADERTKELAFEVDYTRAGGPTVASGEQVPARAHVREVALTNDIFGTYDLTSWTVTGGTPDWIANYANIRDAYAACAVTPSACYLRVLEFGGERRVAELYGKHAEGLSFERFADSQVYLEGWGKDGDLLAPESHDNFFQLDGPILTGSSFWNVAGNPGSPAEVMGWRTIRAEFKDGRVTGTLSENQMIEGVEVVTISFAFEGVLRK